MLESEPFCSALFDELDDYFVQYCYDIVGNQIYMEFDTPNGTPIYVDLVNDPNGYYQVNVTYPESHDEKVFDYPDFSVTHSDVGHEVGRWIIDRVGQ